MRLGSDGISDESRTRGERGGERERERSMALIAADKRKTENKFR